MMRPRGTGSARRGGQAAPPGGTVGALGRGGALLLLALGLALALPPPPLPAPPPPPGPRHRPAEGVSRSRELLAAANGSIHRLKELGTLGFECTLEEVDLEDITENQINTIKACTSEDPGTGNCPVLEGSTFDKSKCLQGIYEDLNTYRAELKNLNDQDVLTTIDEMMKALEPRSSSSSSSSGGGSGGSSGGSGGSSVPRASAGAGLSSSFRERLRLCSVLHAFRIRTVTISRLMSYLSSPESSGPPALGV